jgi:DNA-binding NarL/FixJ family response regulator
MPVAEKAMTPRILLVDDHTLFRSALAGLLKETFDICGEATNGREAVEKVLKFKPDLVLLDISMPVMNGTAAAREIRRLAPETKIVFLSMQDESTILELTEHVGVDGCISKRCEVSELYQMIAKVLQIPYDQPDYEKRVRQFPRQSNR